MNRISGAAAVLLMLSVQVFAGTTSVRVKSFDGFELDASATVPPGLSDPEVKRVVVFIHGSGEQDMDEDLTSVSAPGTTNLFFVDVSNAFVGKGFATVRYNKRSFEMRRRLKEDPSFADSETYKRYGRTPLSSLVGDAGHFVLWAHARFPNARVYLFGHGEGTYVALQEAKDDGSVSGVALVGFFAQTLDTALVEQAVYRNAADFDSLDKNGDGELDKSELSGDDALPTLLRRQMPILDLNHDGKLQKSEFMAGNYAAFLTDDPGTHLREYRIEQADYPRPAEIVRGAKFHVSFFQGEWDNQNPSYAAKAVELMNGVKWRNPNLRFHFFPRLGHALDPRDSYRDLVFRPIDPAALNSMVSELDASWRD